MRSRNCTGRSSRRMWHFLWPEVKDEEEVPITYITNGVHTATWMARRLRLLFDKYIGEDWLERLDDPETWEQGGWHPGCRTVGGAHAPQAQTGILYPQPGPHSAG